MTDDLINPIVEPEVIEEEVEKTETGFDRESVIAVEGLVQRLSEQMDELVNKQKEVGAMLKNIFDNDEELEKAQALAKEAGKTFKERSARLHDTQEVKDLKMKLSEIKDDMKMVQESLDTNLLNYYQMTTTMSFPTPDGNEREYTLKAKLKPKKE